MEKRLCYLFIFMAVVLFSASPTMAATQVDARLDTAAMRIGDLLTLTLSVRSGPGESVRFPDMPQSIGRFELLSSEHSVPQRYEDDNGSALERRSFQVTTFETGPQSIPPLPFSVMRPDGSVDTLYTSELAVTVESLVRDTSAAGDPRPLKGLIGVPRLWHRIALWALAGLALVAVLIYAWRKYLARRDAKGLDKMKSIAPQRPAHLVAMEELERIKAMGLIEKGKIKRFHVLVSDAVRTYLAARYGVDALEMTTWELCSALELEVAPDGGLRELIHELLEACDLVKFAKYKPPLVEINSVFNRAYEVVERCHREKSLREAASQPEDIPESEPGPEKQEAAGSIAGESGLEDEGE